MIEPDLPKDVRGIERARFAHAAISLGSAGVSTVGICSAFEQANEVEQVHDAFAILW